MNAHAMIKAAVLVVAAATLGVCAATADDAVTLAWKFKKGEQLSYVIEQNTISENQFAGQTIKSNMTQIMDIEWKIDSVAADGTAQMTQTIARVRMKVGGPGATGIEYDSSSEEAPQGAAAQIGAVFKVLVGKPIKQKMSPRGTITEVSLPEGLAEDMKKAAPPGPAGAIFNEESFKQMVGMAPTEFADHAVKKGDTWQRKATLSNPGTGGKQTIDTTYTYQGAQEQGGKKVDRIDVTQKTTIEPAGAGAPQIEIKDQQSEGDIDFDRAAGRVIKSRAKLKMSMAGTVMGAKLEQKLTSETKMRLADGAESKALEKSK